MTNIQDTSKILTENLKAFDPMAEGMKKGLKKAAVSVALLDKQTHVGKCDHTLLLHHPYLDSIL